MPSHIRFTMIAGLVAALMIAPGCTGGSSSGSSGDHSSAPKPLPVPAELHAKATAGRVRLTWTLPPGSPVDSVKISRNGTDLAQVPITASGYTDKTVSSRVRYLYEVRTAHGYTLSDPAQLRVRTPVPPLKDARLEGYFNVRPTTVSQSGFETLPDNHFGWHFGPPCSTGPCTAKWSDDQVATIHAPAKRRGGTYRVSYNGFFYGTCSGAHVTSSVRITLHVTKARMIGDEWLATKFTGTMTQSAVEQLGCVSTQAVRKLLGRLYSTG